MSEYTKYNTPIPKTIFDELKLRLTGPMQEGGKRPPSLRVSVIRNNPRIDVFTNIEGDKQNGRISAPMEALTLWGLIAKVEEIANGPNDSQVKITNKTGMPGNQVVLSNTILGKDKEGHCYISVIAADRPKIKFIFLPSAWHEWADKSGNPIPQTELSCIYARAWASMMAKLVANVMVNCFELSNAQASYQNNQNGNNSDGYNKGGYQKDNYQKSSQQKSVPEPNYDEDFPM